MMRFWLLPKSTRTKAMNLLKMGEVFNISLMPLWGDVAAACIFKA